MLLCGLCDNSAFAGKVRRRGVFVLDQVLRSGEHVVDGVLLG